MHWHGPLGHLGDDDIGGRIYDHRVVARLLHIVSPHRWLVAATVVTMLIASGTSVATPWIIGYAVDTVVTQRDLARLNWVLLLFGVNLGVNYATQYAHLALMARVSQNVLYSLRTALFDHLQRLSLAFHDRSEVGRLMSRVQNDVQQLQEFLSIIILGLADLLGLIGIIVVMVLMNATLAGTTLVVLPILVGILALWQTYARLAFWRVRRAIAAVNGALQENISGVRVIQSLNRQEINYRRFDSINQDHLEANLQASRLSSALMPMADLLMAVGLGIVVIFGGIMVLNGALAIGALVAFAMYIQRFFDPIRNLTMQYAQLQRAMASGERIFRLLDIQPDLADAPDAVDLPEIKGEVTFDHVTFWYTPGTPVLHDISFTIQPGQRVGLVGPTGAGKTTIASLVARFYDPSQGRVLVDGHDLRHVRRGSLTRQMGMVLQEPFLFTGTVAENIRFNHTDATDDQVVAAAKAVGAHDFITRLPQGYATVLHERGSNLSVGQRQLIAFARALVADPRILILDEATANVDSATEVQIQRALEVLLAGRTSIIIAHRLSTIRSADLILVLDHGHLVEQGTHSDLLAKGGLYARLYEANFGDITAA